MDDQRPTPVRLHPAYAAAILLPVIGVVLAIRLYARSENGPATALLLTSALAAVGWALVLA